MAAYKIMDFVSTTALCVVTANELVIAKNAIIMMTADQAFMKMKQIVVTKLELHVFIPIVLMM